jgi:hypothetical protein
VIEMSVRENDRCGPALSFEPRSGGRLNGLGRTGNAGVDQDPMAIAASLLSDEYDIGNHDLLVSDVGDQLARSVIACSVSRGVVRLGAFRKLDLILHEDLGNVPG